MVTSKTSQGTNLSKQTNKLGSLYSVKCLFKDSRRIRAGTGACWLVSDACVCGLEGEGICDVLCQSGGYAACLCLMK